MDFNEPEYKIFIALIISIIGHTISYVNTKMAQVDRQSLHLNILQVVISTLSLLIGLSFWVWLFLYISWFAPIVAFVIGFISYLIFVFIATQMYGADGIRKFLYGFVLRYITLFEIINAGLTLILWFGAS